MINNVQVSIANDLAEFLVSSPSLEDLANYEVSAELQHYVDSLLDKNSEGLLSPEERLELEKILAVSHVMSLAKTKAKLKLVKQS